MTPLRSLPVWPRLVAARRRGEKVATLAALAAEAGHRVSDSGLANAFSSAGIHPSRPRAFPTIISAPWWPECAFKIAMGASVADLAAHHGARPYALRSTIEADNLKPIHLRAWFPLAAALSASITIKATARRLRIEPNTLATALRRHPVTQ